MEKQSLPFPAPMQIQRAANRQTLPLNGNSVSTYGPISSVWEGSDSELLEAMFKFYATIPPEPIRMRAGRAGQ